MKIDGRRYSRLGWIFSIVVGLAATAWCVWMLSRIASVAGWK